MTGPSLRPGLSAALAAAAIAAPAPAAITETGPGRYLCEAEPGQVVSREVSDFFRGASMAARIRFLGAGDAAAPQIWAGLSFVLDGDRNASVLVMAHPQSPRYLWVVLDPPGGEESGWLAQLRRESVVEISATMARGAIFARTGDQRGQIRVDDSRLTGRLIVCSSGRFEIELTRSPRRPRRL